MSKLSPPRERYETKNYFSEWKSWQVDGCFKHVSNKHPLKRAHTLQSCESTCSDYSDLAFQHAKETEVETNMRKNFFFLNAESRNLVIIVRRGKMKEVIHDKEPRYEETTLVSKTGKPEPSLSLSCCSKPHIYHTGTSPERKDPHKQSWQGTDSLKWLDEPEYHRVAGLWDERAHCLGLCRSMWL